MLIDGASMQEEGGLIGTSQTTFFKEVKGSKSIFLPQRNKARALVVKTAVTDTKNSCFHPSQFSKPNVGASFFKNALSELGGTPLAQVGGRRLLIFLNSWL